MLATLFAIAALAAAQPASLPDLGAAPPAEAEIEAAPAAPAQAAGDAQRDALEAYVDGLVAVWMAEDPVPALVVSVADADGVLLSKGYGLADIEAGEPASASGTRFEIGSISKTFIWTAVMMLEEQGRLDLYEDVNVYLDGFQVAGGDRPLTLADLMSHRTGWDDTLIMFLPEIDGLDQIDALAAAAPALVHPRGGATAYSNYGSVIAAKLVSDVTGRAFGDFVYEEILRPLGMADTTYLEADRTPDQPPLARSYAPDSGFLKDAFTLDSGAFAAAGSMASTGDDMARWMRFHLNGGTLDGVQLLQPDTHARMQARLFDGREAGADMAHGFMSRPYRDQHVWGHGGSWNEFLSNMQIAQPLGLGVFVSQSGTFAGAYRRLPELVFDNALRADPLNAPPAGAIALDEQALSQYAGRYVSNRRETTGFERLFGAVSIASVSTAEAGGLVFASGGEAERFWPVAEDVFENRRGERIVFQRGEDGRIVRIADASGTNSYETIDASSDPNLLGFAVGAAGFFSLTIWLGLWRRMGRGQTVTLRGRLVSILDLAAAGLVFAFIAASVYALVDTGERGIEIVASYPPGPFMLMAAAGSGVALAALLAVLASAPAFIGSGWSIWRKIHHGLFAVAIAALAVMLVRWELAFSWPFTP